MKKSMALIFHIKSYGCMIFAASILAYGLFCLIFGWTDSLKISVIFQFAGLSLLLSTWQYVCFTEKVFKKMKYIWRFVLFTVPWYVLFMVLANVLNWFTINSIEQWLLYTAIFFAIEGGISIAYFIFTKFTKERWDKQLKSYQENMEQ